MGASTHTSTSRKKPVTVVVDRRKTIPQPDGFRVCPLGIQFYSTKPLARFKLLSFNISVSGNGKGSGRISCCGAVVHCLRDAKKGCYRIWVKFLDLPKSKEKQIRCVAKSSRLLCPYCENF
ncbi:MAG: hypothetical protein V1873_06330 [Verrucomicrobiota bacterium]